MSKHQPLFAILLLIPFISAAQITVDQNDFAGSANSVYLSNGQINPLLNAAATGANYTWNFSTLRSSGQQQIDYLTVASTNPIYAFYYADVAFNVNRANIALKGTDIPFAQILGMTNPYTFYYKNGNMYKKVGYGGELAGLPVPVSMDVPDTIYRFPMTFGNTSSSFSSYSASLPGIANTVYTQTRVTTIDGWGQVTTPYGTFNVLRSKSEIYGNDSIYTIALNSGINIPRSKVTEYKWIAKNEKVPVLQINTTTLFGIEIINSILFKDAKLNITIDSITGTLCPGSQVTVDYTSAGTFNPSAFLQPGNRFTVQLSNNSGSFSNPVNIGNVTATSSGSISCTIPNNTTGGTGYMIRITSNSPTDTSVVFGPITIHPNPTASITANGATTICTYDSLELTANSGFDFLYQWQLNASNISGATSTTYFASAAGNYTLVVSNVCGTANSSPVAITVDPDPIHSIVPSDTSTCDGSPIVVTAYNTSGASPVTYQWLGNGDSILGAIDSVITVTVTGDYSLIVADGFGCKFVSSPLTLEIDSMDTPLVHTNGSATFCPGGTITLSTDTSADFFYQWRLNGVDIPGATSETYTTSLGGDYTVIVRDTCDFATSAITEVTVTARPVHTITPSSPASCDGNPITITTFNISGASPVTYQWYESGIAIAGATDTFLIVNAPGDYSLIVTDRFGCFFNSADYPIVFGTLPAPALYSDGATSFCHGESVTFSTDTNYQYTYQWLLDGAVIGGATSSSYIATQEGNYSVEISIGNGCNATSTIEKVNVTPQPSAPTITQQGDSLFSSSAVEYQWFLNGSVLPGATSQAYKPGIDGNYAVMITDNNGCTNVSIPFYVSGTGINDPSTNWHIGIYPNPVSNSAFTVNSSEEFSGIQIFNAVGSLVIELEFGRTKTALIVGSMLQPGVYFAVLKTETRARAVKMVKI